MIALVHQHAKGEGQESLREGAHPVLTHVCPLGGGYAAGLELLYGLDRPPRASVIVSDHFVCMLCHCRSIPVGRRVLRTRHA